MPKSLANNTPLLHVTDIVNQYMPFKGGYVKDEVLKRKMRLGKVSHAAIAMDARDKLDYDQLHDDIKPYVDAWRLARDEMSIKVLQSETYMECADLGLCGTTDMICNLKGEKTIIDFKCGVKDDVKHFLQLTGYTILHEISSSDIKESYVEKIKTSTINRCILYLKNNGHFIIVKDLKSFDDQANIFMSMLNVMALQIRLGIIDIPERSRIEFHNCDDTIH